jgi:hypothetical protein
MVWAVIPVRWQNSLFLMVLELTNHLGGLVVPVLERIETAQELEVVKENRR